MCVNRIDKVKMDGVRKDNLEKSMQKALYEDESCSSH